MLLSLLAVISVLTDVGLLIGLLVSLHVLRTMIILLLHGVFLVIFIITLPLLILILLTMPLIIPPVGFLSNVDATCPGRRTVRMSVKFNIFNRWE